MTGPVRFVWLTLGLAPYLALIGVDAWIHERARKVPGVERGIHYTSAVVLIGFLAGVFTGRSTLAASCLAIFVPLLAWDALVYHRTLERTERRVHLAAYLAFALFVVVWRWTVTQA